MGAEVSAVMAPMRRRQHRGDALMGYSFIRAFLHELITATLGCRVGILGRRAERVSSPRMQRVFRLPHHGSLQSRPLSGHQLLFRQSLPPLPSTRGVPLAQANSSHRSRHFSS